ILYGLLDGAKVVGQFERVLELHPLEGRERLLPRPGDVEQRVELRQLEQRAEVVVQICQAQLAALLADLLRQAHEYAQTGRVDVPRAGEIDQELARAGLQLLEDLLLQLLPVSDDQLTLDVNRGDVALLLHIEAHPPPSVLDRVAGKKTDPGPGKIGARPQLCNAVTQATFTMSSGLAPRDRSLQGRASPWRIGPMASARASLCTSLYAMLPASRSGKTSTLAFPPSGESGALRRATDSINAASACSSPSATTSGRSVRKRSSPARTRSTSGPEALPRVENDRNATRGSSSTTFRRASLAAAAMSACCSTVGVGTTPASVNVSTSGASVPRNGGTTM